jgi:iron-sulfur cluster insertion protein
MLTLTLTERAAEAVQARMRESGVEGFYLKLAVVGGGCNGLSYDLYFVDKPASTDSETESRGVRMLADEASARLLDGTLIDLPSASSGFRFDNPRAKKTCSCGASFEI